MGTYHYERLLDRCIQLIRTISDRLAVNDATLTSGFLLAAFQERETEILFPGAEPCSRDLSPRCYSRGKRYTVNTRSNYRVAFRRGYPAAELR